jgi:predicted DNA-binding antitoxin AbrB/MazE fold protein
MIRAVYRDGVIQPLGSVPSDWPEGLTLEIHPVQPVNVESDTDNWINERGAYANYTGEMPQHVREELERRIAEFHALGPMEFEPGEREEMEKVWKEMDELGRRETKRMWDGQF